MAQSRKYGKCFSEAKPHRATGHFLGREELTFGTHFGNFENELCPHFIELIMNIDTMLALPGGIVNLPDGQQGRSFPHKHPFTEVFHWIGTDPYNPGDLGGKMEFWLGEGEEAEGIWSEKPFSVVAPPGTTHTPITIREIHKPILTLTICDYPTSPSSRISVEKVPSNYKIDRKSGDAMPKVQKYKNNFNEINITDAPVFPSHKGKSHIAMLHDYKQNQLAPHYLKVDMIYGSGIGWGCGDTFKINDTRIAGIVDTVRSLPVKHPFTVSYYFYSLAEDLEHAEDLGGEVEFWIGEGAEAEQYIFTKPTFVFIPPRIVHQPIYIREVHRPFFMVTLLDTPLWAGSYIEKFPPAFKHISAGK
jgi:hypothetical protein